MTVGHGTLRGGVPCDPALGRRHVTHRVRDCSSSPCSSSWPFSCWMVCIWLCTSRCCVSTAVLSSCTCREAESSAAVPGSQEHRRACLPAVTVCRAGPGERCRHPSKYTHSQQHRAQTRQQCEEGSDATQGAHACGRGHLPSKLLHLCGRTFILWPMLIKGIMRHVYWHCGQHAMAIAATWGLRCCCRWPLLASLRGGKDIALPLLAAAHPQGCALPAPLLTARQCPRNEWPMLPLLC